MTAFVPGKIMLAGEYAVLRPGGRALVAALNRGVNVTARPTALHGNVRLTLGARTAEGRVVTKDIEWQTPVPQELAFAAAGLALAVRHGGEVANTEIVLESALVHEGHKLGLGGSAATLVAGFRGGAPTVALPLAALIDAHRALQGGRGSGADVAACAVGGLVRYTNPGRAERVALPADLRLLLGWTRTPASTPALIAAIDPRRHARALDAVAVAEQELAIALDSGDRTGVLAAVERAGDAARALGEGAGIAIETPALTALRNAARQAGCAGKSAGAGGGDCGVVVCFGDAARTRAAAALERADLVPLSVEIYLK